MLQTVVGGTSCPPPHPCLASPTSPAQKLVFNRVNGKRPQVLLQQVSAPEECYTLAHEENVRFVYEGEGRGSLGTGTRLLLHPWGGGLEHVGSFLRQLHRAGDLGGRDRVLSLSPPLPLAPAPLPQPPLGWEIRIPKLSTACSSPPTPPPHPTSLAAGRAAVGWQPERGERLRPRAVRRENPQPRIEK